jgi:hypothetical protein
VGQAAITTLMIGTMAQLDSEIASGLARAGLVQAVCLRVVEFRVPNWHIVGAA